MVTLFFEKISDTLARPTLLYYDSAPADLLTTREYIQVESIPKPKSIKYKNSVLYVNPQTKDMWYEYVDRPLTIDEQLEQFLKTSDDKYKEIDLSIADLQTVKASKMAQLEELCNKAITGGFDFTINGISYRFSCSLEAQANFQGTDTLFKDGLITEAEWTVVNNATGTIERVVIDQATFNSIKLQVFQHINSNISKLRNTLQPQVEAATTNTEVDAVVW